jgi:hypothetical protein
MPTYLTPGVYVEAISAQPGSPEGAREVVAGAVDELLKGSDAFAALDPERRRAVAGAMSEVTTAVMTSSPAAERTPGPADILLAQVDFPAFVGDLVHGVFGAVVGASIEQMNAYADLIAGVATAAGELDGEVATECEARALLTAALFAGVAASASRGGR